MEIFVFAAFLAAAGPAVPAPLSKLPPYEESIRCAGLAEAASRLEKHGSAPGKAAFDAAIFWGMAASEAARKDGLSGARFTVDQEAAAAKGAADLRALGTKGLEELALCIARVPRPNPSRQGERG